MNSLTLEEKKVLKVCDLIEELGIEVNAEFIETLLVQCNRNALHLKYDEETYHTDKFSEESWMIDIHKFK